jgi:hypothetical protein
LILIASFRWANWWRGRAVTAGSGVAAPVGAAVEVGCAESYHIGKACLLNSLQIASESILNDCLLSSETEFIIDLGFVWGVFGGENPAEKWVKENVYYDPCGR